MVAFLRRRPRAQAILFGRFEWRAELAAPTSSIAGQSVRQEQRNLAQVRRFWLVANRRCEKCDKQLCLRCCFQTEQLAREQLTGGIVSVHATNDPSGRIVSQKVCHRVKQFNDKR